MNDPTYCEFCKRWHRPSDGCGIDRVSDGSPPWPRPASCQMSPVLRTEVTPARFQRDGLALHLYFAPTAPRLELEGERRKAR